MQVLEALADIEAAPEASFCNRSEDAPTVHSIETPQKESIEMSSAAAPQAVQQPTSPECSPSQSPKTVGVAVVGCGYWGPNLVRNFAECSQTEIEMVCDREQRCLDRIATRFPWVNTTTDFEKVLKNPNVQAVAIATPVETHYRIAKEALLAGRHVLVEKPLASTTEQAEELVALAIKQNVKLMVDHTFVYTPAVQHIHNLIHSGELGDVLYYDSSRINLGLVQRDVNVLWDLAVHDLSIIQYLLKDKPDAVSATGMKHIPGRPETIAWLTIHFPEGVIAHCHVNWLSPVKVRRILIGGNRKMVVYDDVEPTEKVRIYDSGVKLLSPDPETSDFRHMVEYRKGDVWIPHLPGTEALATEVSHFADCILNDKHPLTNGQAGIQLVKMLEAASKSLRLKGQPIPV